MDSVKISWKIIEMFLLNCAGPWWAAFYIYNSELARNPIKTGATEYFNRKLQECSSLRNLLQIYGPDQFQLETATTFFVCLLFLSDFCWRNFCEELCSAWSWCLEWYSSIGSFLFPYPWLIILGVWPVHLLIELMLDLLHYHKFSLPSGLGWTWP